SPCRTRPDPGRHHPAALEAHPPLFRDERGTVPHRGISGMPARRSRAGALGRQRGVPAQGRGVLPLDRAPPRPLPAGGHRAGRSADGHRRPETGPPAHQLLGGCRAAHPPAARSRTAAGNARFLLPPGVRLAARYVLDPRQLFPPRNRPTGLFGAFANPTPVRSSDMKSTTLFERLGGSAGISAVVEDIVALHMENPAIRARFRPYLERPEKLAATKQHLGAFLESGSGGTARYTGRSMLETHRGMNISEAEYMAALDDIL